MPRSTKDKTTNTEARAVVNALAPPTALEQLVEWRQKVAARLANARASLLPRAPKPAPKKKR